MRRGLTRKARRRSHLMNLSSLEPFVHLVISSGLRDHPDFSVLSAFITNTFRAPDSELR